MMASDDTRMGLRLLELETGIAEVPSDAACPTLDLGDHIEHYLRAKRQEWEEYISHVHPWEQERYLAEY
jgi:glutamine synthetase